MGTTTATIVRQQQPLVTCPRCKGRHESLTSIVIDEKSRKVCSICAAELAYEQGAVVYTEF